MITNIQPENIEGFQLRSNDYGKALLLSENRIKESQIFVEKFEIKGLEINYRFDYNLPDLSCLEFFPSIKHLRVVNNVTDLSGLKYLKGLNTLELGGKNNEEIDFTMFQELESCYLSWHEKRASILDCTKLKRLGIESYKAHDLTGLNNLVYLEYLGIGNSSISSLVGMGELKNLKELSLNYLSKIQDLEGIDKLKGLEQLELINLNKISSLKFLDNLENLVELTIEKCKSIKDIEILSRLCKLKRLTINNLGKISSLKPIESLVNLKELFFIENTDIMDGNLSPIVNLKSYSLNKFSFQNRRHYSHKREELGWPECLRS